MKNNVRSPRQKVWPTFVMVVVVLASAFPHTAPALAARSVTQEGSPPVSAPVPPPSPEIDAAPAEAAPAEAVPAEVAQPAGAEAVLDTPIPISQQSFDDWTFSNGLLYWWQQSCPIGLASTSQNVQAGANAQVAGSPQSSQAALAPYFMKRMPASGGTVRTLAERTLCGGFGSPVSDAQGIYYFNGISGTLEFRPSGSPFDPPVVLSQTTYSFAPIVAAGDFVYWVTSDFNLFRIRRDGTGQQTVATGVGSIYSLLVSGTTVYWLNPTHLNTISTNCATLPCGSPQTLTPATGFFNKSLILVSGLIAGSYSLMWVEDSPTGVPDRIRRYSCNIFTPICSVGTYYTASDTSWNIGNITARNSNLFWHENAADHRILRRALSDTTNPPNEIVTNEPGLYSNLYTDANFLYFAKYLPSQGFYKIPLNATAITRDLAVDAMEVTQAIQNLANDVPLIKDKPAYVRVYAKQLAGPNALSVNAVLIGRRNGNTLPGSPLRPVNGVLPLATGGTYNRVNKNAGWLFRLPSSWLNGNVEFTAVVDPNHAYTDPVPGNNSLIKSLPFQSQSPLCILAVPVRTHTPNPSVYDPNFFGMVDRFKKLWPVSDINLYRTGMVIEEPQVCWWGPFPYPCGGPFELDETGLIDDKDMAMGLLILVSLGWSVTCGIGGNGSAHTMGMVNPYAPTGGLAGYANLYIHASWVQSPPFSPNPFPNTWNSMYQGGVMAQELAHNYTRNHVNCGNPSGIDNNYPYPPCQLDNVGPANHYGFDIASLTPIAPNQATDFMSYGGNNWVSDYTYEALFNKFLAQANTAAAAAPELFPKPVAPVGTDEANPSKTSATRQVYVVGTLDMAANRGNLISLRVLDDAVVGEVSMAKWQALKAQAEAAKLDTQHVHDDGSVHVHPSEATVTTTYHLRLLNSANAVLFDQPVNVFPGDNHEPGETPALFTLNTPAPTGAVARAELLANNTILDVISMGVNTPTISILQPAGGENVGSSLTVQWLGSDPDNDPVLYGVQYSHDNGVSWTPIVEQYAGSPVEITKTLVITSLNSLHGSNGASARIRVIGSDGYQTAVALSNPFTFADRSPEPYILNPTSADYHSPTEPIVLHGGAMDAEDGDLHGISLTWAVNGNAAGTDADQMAEGLAPGSHTVTLAASDSASQVATATSQLNINPLSIPVANTLLLDGDCNDAGYANSARLPLKPYGDDNQATAQLIRTATDLWVCFSHLARGSTTPGAFVGLRADVDFSRDSLAQGTDLGFFVGEDGGVFTYAGDGAGGFAQPGPAGLTAQVSAITPTWQAELRIPAALLNGFEHTIGLNLGHYWVGSQGDDYMWPYASVWNGPNTWARTALGLQPEITALSPYTATAGSPAFTLGVQGNGFVSGTVVLWNNAALPTVFSDTTALSVSVSAAEVAAGGVAVVTARNPGAGNFVSNPANFTVINLAPTLTRVSPNVKPAGGPAFTLVVTGANYLNGATVLWNGVSLPTTFVNATRLQAQVPANLIEIGQTAGISVRNPAPDAQTSSSLPFAVPPPGQLFVPVILRVQ